MGGGARTKFPIGEAESGVCIAHAMEVVRDTGWSLLSQLCQRLATAWARCVRNVCGVISQGLWPCYSLQSPVAAMPRVRTSQFTGRRLWRRLKSFGLVSFDVRSVVSGRCFVCTCRCSVYEELRIGCMPLCGDDDA